MGPWLVLVSPCFRENVAVRVLRGKVFGTPIPYCPVIFYPGPDRTGPKQFSINPKLASFDPDRPENSEVCKIFCVEIKDLSFKSSFRLQTTPEYALQ